METIKIYYNGFRIGDSKELVKASIGIDAKTGIITMYAKDYSDLPRGYGFNVINESDGMTDYFESDRARVQPEHPLYKFLCYAAFKADAMFAKRMLAKGYKDEYHYAEKIAAFEALKNPGQPTEADIKALETWIEDKKAQAKAEKEIREALEEEEREAQRFIEKTETEMTIYKWEMEYPLQQGQALVEIPFSERLGIQNGSKWSFKAAQNIFEELDRREHAKHQGYDKTDFVIRWTEKDGEESSYRGRYDIGDGENGLLQHIFNFAEWHRTHTQWGQPLDNPPQTTRNIELYNRLVELYNV